MTGPVPGAAHAQEDGFLMPLLYPLYSALPPLLLLLLFQSGQGKFIQQIPLPLALSFTCLVTTRDYWEAKLQSPKLLSGKADLTPS